MVGGGPDVEARWFRERKQKRGKVVSVELHDRPQSGQMRRLFLVELIKQVRVLWPILSGIIAVMAGAGFIVGRIENWRIDESLYFAFVTGLTIGYGDFTPKHFSARLLAVAIAVCGVVLIGLVSAISVEALREADRDKDE